ncbi:hypothetical protein GQ42DRAFT_152211 [Ramicandelaber brevisporus]|nr:hypothetical protein GQ42DRAFT_152211 [Ramicandelaber brevisporus]
MQPQTKRARLDPAVVAAVAPVCQLFRLPRKLLELVAAYFSRREAVPVLTVNSTLHEIFAERIWRRLDSDRVWCRLDTYLVNSRRSIPLESLPRYGHLVRRMRVTWRTLESTDLAAAFPNVTRLRIPLSRLADTIKSSQGKCFERLCHLDVCDLEDYDGFENLDETDPVLNWIDSRFEDEAGLEKVQWELFQYNDDQYVERLLPWFRSHCAMNRLCFKISDQGINLTDFEDTDTRALVSSYLVDWDTSVDSNCTAAEFSGILDTIPSAERQHFQFPALKSLKIGTCCDAGDEVYPQFNFGKLFPSVQNLTLDGSSQVCSNITESLIPILANPWPSVRKLDLYGVTIFKNTISYLAAVSNVEELSVDQESPADYETLRIVNLFELGRALPKLVRLEITGTNVVSAPPKQQLGQQQLFCHLRYVTLGADVTSSAIRALAHAPSLTDICLKGIDFMNDDNVDVLNQLGRDGYKEMDLANNVDFLAGVTNTTVRSVDICNVNGYRLLADYEGIIRVMLRCFAKLRVFIIRTNEKDALPGLVDEFPVVKFICGK